MAEVFDFGELENDDNFKTKIIELNENVENAASILNNFFSNTDYDSLSLEDKVRFDLLLAFAINTFYWIHLRTQGIDPANHEIKHQINRIKDYMLQSKKLYDKKKFMPVIDKDAAKRFIRSGLWTPNTSSSNTELTTSDTSNTQTINNDINVKMSH
ncbi:conserved hypothetical protein [Pediculus humanus corporis]|uniref:Nuclear nucleic acid-binding protein C1D n=1 Tax=Pediculus humanus subsp. corporis TaxID=121224 RepID=E0VG57_PEDHC|nr:uncharacterized protein Phum_PHUM173900 [Pediculus humanus corporis]EEB12363.1 conserved hypothetical protein [Pediculus humanus corporis]